MNGPFQCINCKRLGHCAETNEDKVLSGYYCDRWEEVRPEILAARQQIIQLFGKQGVKAVVSSDQDEED